MKNIVTNLFLILCVSTSVLAQDKNLPFYEIPKAPETYTAGTVAARMVDGLGFRYYWATEGLTEKDLAYKASESGRTCGQTIDHILSLTNTIYQSVTNQKTPIKIDEMSFEEKRTLTLTKLMEVREVLKESKNLEEQSKSFPFWNNINGPIGDALWHAGQIVVLRRAAGNPIPSGVNFFSGTKK
ncbi:DUF664 domain-containing protein [Flavobacteriaceae bacterium F08102]|nr:DUF664 domain-containing protein [Flavobacteriaceae bacterium F08102]